MATVAKKWVDELMGAELDCWVARAEGLKTRIAGGIALTEDEQPYQPSTDWAQGGPIIEREEISLIPDAHNDEKDSSIDLWIAQTWADARADRESEGDTPLIAAMRCYVASKFGDEVDATA